VCVCRVLIHIYIIILKKNFYLNMDTSTSNLKKLDKFLDKFDRISNLWRQIDRLNQAALVDIQGNPTERNKFVNGIRSLQSNLRRHFRDKPDILKKLQDFKDEYKNAIDIEKKSELIFNKYDLLNEIIDDSVEPAEYSTVEEITEDNINGRINRDD
jgi:hypothetical protein